jgi:hypothetical protein
MMIKVCDNAYVRFNAPDLDVMEKFATAFGLERAARDERTLYMRGADDDRYVHVTHLADTAKFAGVAFVADLDVLTREHGFTAAADFDGPGGGRVVHAVGPNCNRVEVVADRGSLGAPPSLSPLSKTCLSKSSRD